MKILIADDEIVTRRTLEKRLNSWGYETVVAEDGDAALELLQRDTSIDIALLDWIMPGLTGVEVCREIKKLSDQRYVYCVILTGKTDKESFVYAVEEGADDFVSKPFDPQVLKVRLRAGERILAAGRQLKELNASLDKQVQERTKELKLAVKAAEHASEMKSTFLANMSHEIRTPLNGIVSYVELLLYSDLNDEQREDLRTVQGCVSNLRTIINDVLDFSKIEAGKMHIDNSPFDIREAVQEVVSILDAKREESGLELLVDVAHTVPKVVVGDRVRVQQILMNLLGNSFKFSTQGGGIIVRVEQVAFDPVLETSRLHFGVADCGIGIPKDKLHEIFESFTQADSTTTRKFGGTGLGLTICKKLCDLMDGRIWVESISGFGSTFHFELPFAVEDSSYAVEKGQTTIQAGNGNGRRVLLAEDNIINQRAVERLLHRFGYEVTTASNGKEVLERIEEQQFDVLLLDIQMPILDGIETAARIKERGDARSSMPIIGLTANAFDADKEKYFSLGMSDVVSKPINYEELFRSIENLTVPGGLYD